MQCDCPASITTLPAPQPLQKRKHYPPTHHHHHHHQRYQRATLGANLHGSSIPHMAIVAVHHDPHRKITAITTHGGYQCRWEGINPTLKQRYSKRTHEDKDSPSSQSEFPTTDRSFFQPQTHHNHPPGSRLHPKDLSLSLTHTHIHNININIQRI